MPEAGPSCFLSQGTREGWLQLKSQGQGRCLPMKAQSGEAVRIVND